MVRNLGRLGGGLPRRRLPGPVGENSIPDGKNIDQLCAGVRDSVPRLWFALYAGCLQAGFDPAQSMALLQTYVLSQNPAGIRPPPSDGPRPEDEQS